ncbi:MAG: DUF4282 domain-containing protein [Gammaproteobacteria bacterium]|nr:DUF4282 domain-containing protein [Gammaproteobacteria bacterium]
MDFLSFKTFISIEVLIVFYYIGAVIFPVGLWILMSWLIRRFSIFSDGYKVAKELFWNSLTNKQKIKVLILFFVLFLFMELFWRMLFEFLIAYMQMRDALIK